MNHQINIDEAIAIAKEYHLETALAVLFICLINKLKKRYDIRTISKS